MKKSHSRHKFTLSIYGSIPKKDYLHYLKELIKSNNLESLVFWGGNQNHSKIPKVLIEHDLLLFPSIPKRNNHTIEGCPNILLEAMASGIPIISTLNDGTKEILKNNENCLLAEPNPDDFENKIQLLIGNKGFLSKIAHNAYQNIKKHFQKSQYQKTLLKLLELEKIN